MWIKTWYNENSSQCCVYHKDLASKTMSSPELKFSFKLKLLPCFSSLTDLVLKSIILCIIFSPISVSGLHAYGVWNVNEPFKFIAKFGFQKTNLNDRTNTLGYIYGNIFAAHNNSLTHKGILVVVDRDYFLELYGNRTVTNRVEACQKMFSKIDTVAYDRYCNEDGKQDFLRNVPCNSKTICEDEDVPERVVPGYQFTYVVQDDNQPRFWYIVLVSCYREGVKPKCIWKDSSSENISISYDIWLANGNPYISTRNYFDFQFSFDQQGTLQMFLFLTILYLVLLPLQIYAVVQQHHHITKLFTVSLVLKFLSCFLLLADKVKFAIDGEGLESINIVGEILHFLSECNFMLLLLLLAKGWAITRTKLTWKPVIFCIWVLYTCINVLLYVWNMTEVDVIEDIDEYQTFPGWIMLIFRLIIMVWFLYELRLTMMDENDRHKLRFYLNFGAGILVWFVYLPVVAIIALNVSALWRQKLIYGISSCADFLVFATMTHLLWPTRSQQYFELAVEADIGDELDEFNESPHNIPRPPKA